MLSIILLKNTKEEWGSTIVSILSEQIVNSNRRIKKGVNVSFETKRYNSSCDALEYFAVKISNKENTMIFDRKSSSHIIENFYLNKNIPFITVNELSKMFQINETIKEEYSAGVLISKPFSNFSFGKSIKNSSDVDYFNSDLLDSISLEGIEFDSNQEKDLFDKIKRGLFNKTAVGRHKFRLNEKVKSKKEGLEKFSKVRHEVITKVLRKLAYHNIELVNNPFVRYGYNDGSVGGKINLFQLIENKTHIDGLFIYNISLISNRHFELDDKIDFCFLRNVEINGNDNTYAMQEFEAYERIKKQIEMLLNYHSRLKINLYHSGLEPAIIGAYRAVIDVKLTRGDVVLLVEPFITEEKKLETWN